MDNGLVINLIRISIQPHPVAIFYSTKENSNLRHSIKKRDADFPEATKDQDVWWDFEEFAGSTRQEITPEQNKNLFSQFLTLKLYTYFRDNGLICGNNFIRGVSIWIPDPDREVIYQDFETYTKFDLRILHDKQQKISGDGEWCLHLAYSGTSQVSVRPVKDYQVDKLLLNKLIYGNEIYKLDSINPLNIDQARFVLNYNLRESMGLPWKAKKITNSYLDYFTNIDNFYSSHLSGKNILGAFLVQESEFLPISKNKLMRLEPSSTLLEFKEGNTHFNNYQGLKKYGPVRGPESSNLKMFFIFHEADKDNANKLYQYLKKGLKGFPGLEQFVNVPLVLDTEKTIRYTNNDDPSNEIIRKIDELKLDDNHEYFAFYITRVKKDNATDSQKAIYYKIKSALINKSINSQVVYRDNIDNPSFNYFLPNIAIAVLGKLNGIPWRLSRPIESDLIIGIGAYKPATGGKYLGTTICFKNDGTFQGFDAIQSDNIEKLGEFFKNIISQSTLHETPKRVVIHFYKWMSGDEEKQLKSALDQLDLTIPYVVLNITDRHSNSFVIFDRDYPALMPTSGTVVRIRRGEYIVCNNQRYQFDAKMKIDDFPLPMKINISKAHGNIIDDSDVPKLLDQVIQFSRMYWVGIKHRSKPVTILYSEMLAKMKERYKDFKFPSNEKAHKTLWFL